MNSQGLTQRKLALQRQLALTLQQSQSQEDAKAKIHQELTQRQLTFQLPFVLQHESN